MLTALALVMSWLQVEAPPLRNPSGAWVLNRHASEQPQTDREISSSVRDQLGSLPDRLILSVTATTVTFFDSGGLRRVFRISEAKMADNTNRKWFGSRVRRDRAGLTIERRTSQGLRVTENYFVDPRSGRLVATIIAASSEREVSRVRGVYNPLAQ
jgi:hypothetical protein